MKKSLLDCLEYPLIAAFPQANRYGVFQRLLLPAFIVKAHDTTAPGNCGVVIDLWSLQRLETKFHALCDAKELIDTSQLAFAQGRPQRPNPSAIAAPIRFFIAPSACTIILAAISV